MTCYQCGRQPGDLCKNEDGCTEHDAPMHSAKSIPIPRFLRGLPELRDGEPCDHRGCLSHVSHPCEGCGRIAGRSVTPNV